MPEEQWLFVHKRMDRVQPKNPNRTRSGDRAGTINRNFSTSSNSNSTSNRGEVGSLSLQKAQDVLNTLQLDWQSIVTEKFNPVPLALELIDESSLGRDFVQFETLLKQVNRSVVEVVNEHYHQFNSTTTIFTGVQTEVTASQVQVKEMKTDLFQCKEKLTTKRSDLSVLWSKTKQYNAMLNILDQLDQLKQIPEKLETLLNDKYYFTALKLLLTTLNQLDSELLKPIKATSELKRSLLKIKNSLHDTLIEEIHNHVYLKIHLNHEFEEFNNTSKLAKFQATMSKYLNVDYTQYNLLFNPSKPSSTDITNPVQELEDLGTDPESDSLHFLRVLVLCLKLLGKLPEALDRIKSRVPVELYQLVDKTIGEVESRLNPNLLGEENQEEAKFKLTTLADRLFQKFELVLSYHQFIVKLIRDLYKPNNYLVTAYQEESPTLPNPTNLNKRLSSLRLTRELKVPSYNLKEVWSSVQSEIRSMLTDYLTDPHLQTSLPHLATSSHHLNPLNRPNSKGLEGKKQLFKFRAEELDCTTNSLTQLYANVHLRIQTSTVSLPTQKLLQLPTSNATTHLDPTPTFGLEEPRATSLSPPTSHSRELADVSKLIVNLASVTTDKFALHHQLATEHRLVTYPDVYHVSLLIPACQRFLNRILPFLNLKDAEVGGNGSGGKLVFLEEFGIQVLLPQLTLQAHHQLVYATNGPNAFKVGTKLDGKIPRLQGFDAMVDLISKLVDTIVNLPFPSLAYIDIVNSVLSAFLDRCQRCYKGVVSTVTNNSEDSSSVGTVVSSMWAQTPELLTLFKDHPYVSNNPVDEELERQLNLKEISVEIGLKLRKSLHTSELLFDQRRIAMLATLSHSLRTFVQLVERVVQDQPIQLRSDLLLNFRKLADLSLITLRVEFRCHVMYYVDLAVREGEYYLPHDAPTSIDSYISSLNADLTLCHNVLEKLLTPADLRFVYGGIGTFLSQALIASENVRAIGTLSTTGLTKMLRNLQAIQSNLIHLNLPDSEGIHLAFRYFKLYDLDLETFASRAKGFLHLFTVPQLKALLDLTLKTLELELQVPELEQKHGRNLLPRKKVDQEGNPNKGGQGEDRLGEKVNHLIIQAYHNQLMQLRELEEAEEE